MNSYRILDKQIYVAGKYSLVPIRFDDRFLIMKWRNEQIYHLRQNKPLTKEDQDKYFNEIIANIFKQEQPKQILFSYLDNKKCIGYGGLVHINWIDKNAEISFIIDTSLEKEFFQIHWTRYLKLIEEVAFYELGFYKIYTYAFDIRPGLYGVLENSDYRKEAVLKQHVCFEGDFIDVVIHSKFADRLILRNAKIFDSELTFRWATNPVIRKFSFHQEEIKWENHQEWFKVKIADNNCEYYILNEKGKGIGSIRFDISEELNAKISYLIDPVYHGRGYGRIILDEGIKRLKTRRKDIKKVFGLVKKENIASIRIFEGFDFQTMAEETGYLRFEKIL
jgi:RimJ/RimL family protein N-acetyltransferase